MRIVPAAMAVLLLAGCGARSSTDVEALAEKTARLEARVEALEGLLDRVTAVVELPAEPEREQAALGLAEEIRADLDALRMAEARDGLERLVRDYSDTMVARSAGDLLDTLEIIGQPATELPVAGWLQGEHTLDPERTTLVVFFEAWCPHCQREMPELARTWEALSGEGLDMVGVTSLSRGTTEEEMTAFLDEGEVGFPVARDDGRLWATFRAEGVPHAVVLKGGEVRWVGHPAMLEDGDLTTLMAR
jgi:thiol-disulfide isomerase/thioredoxin/outer membrane murein-binding lipoprotein Lpp